MYTITLNTLWLTSYYVCVMDVLINVIATITLYALSIAISVSYMSTNLEKNNKYILNKSSLEQSLC